MNSFQNIRYQLENGTLKPFSDIDIPLRPKFLPRTFAHKETINQEIIIQEHREDEDDPASSVHINRSKSVMFEYDRLGRIMDLIENTCHSYMIRINECCEELNRLDETDTMNIIHINFYINLSLFYDNLIDKLMNSQRVITLRENVNTITTRYETVMIHLLNQNRFNTVEITTTNEREQKKEIREKSYVMAKKKLMTVMPDNCAICLENHIYIKGCTLSCNHEFGFECFKKWSKNNSTCPICRKQTEIIKTYRQRLSSI